VWLSRLKIALFETLAQIKPRFRAARKRFESN